jgi:uncharacterized membrane protein
MKLKDLRLFLGPISSAIYLTPTLVSAEFKEIGDVAKKLCEVMNWFYTFALIIGIIFIIIAAFKYMMAGGDTEKFSQAHKALIYGVIGIAVAILAKSVPFVVGSFLGSNESALGVCEK